MEAWTQFFVRSGVPNEVSKKYAKSFVTNRITKEMLSDLDKSTLAELGVTAIGDQLLILKRIKAAKSSLSAGNDDDDEEEEAVKVQKPQKMRITGPSSASESASDHRRGKPPPDRHEIYHVKMPFGNTARTQKILQKADNMRKLGLAVRGTTGVRQGGRSVSPIDKSSLPARLVRKQNSEVSSTTDRRMQRMGIQGMHSDKMSGVTKIQRVTNSRIQKVNRPLGNMVVSRSITSSSRGSSSGIRIDMGSNNNRNRKLTSRLSRNNGSRLQHEQVEYSSDYELEEEDMETDDGIVRVQYRDVDDDELIDDDDDDTLQVPSSSSVHQRISYATSSAPSRAPNNRRRAPISTRLATVIDQSDSIFSRVSYHRS